MKKTLFSLAALTATLFITSSCVIERRHAQDGTISEGLDVLTVAVPNFTSIDAWGAVQVHYTPGPLDSVCVEGDPEDIARFEVKVDGDELNVGPSSSMYVGRSSRRTTVVYIQAPNVGEFDISGASSLDITAPYTTSRLDVDVSGASHFSAPSVVCTRASFDASGASGIDCSLDSTSFIEAEASGASNVSLNLNRCGGIDCSASGASGISISGTVNNVSLESSGASRVHDNTQKWQ